MNPNGLTSEPNPALCCCRGTTESSHKSTRKPGFNLLLVMLQVHQRKTTPQEAKQKLRTTEEPKGSQEVQKKGAQDVRTEL